MEETHQKVIEDIQRQHQREISKLMEERERLLAEETAATIAGEETVSPAVITVISKHSKSNLYVSLNYDEAIEAMKNAHKEELEKTQRSQLSGLNSDIDELRLQYEYVTIVVFLFIVRTGVTSVGPEYIVLFNEFLLK